jgi:Mrp family chromosome partitioning ATPase
VPAAAIEELARELGSGGEGARRITVIGAVPMVDTATTAIALARNLAQQTRVVLVDLAHSPEDGRPSGAPQLSRIASDPSIPGLAELVQGTASFGQIITRDRYSRVHLIMAGQAQGGAQVDTAALMTSQRLSITIEALGRSYDHVIIDAGTAGKTAIERFANLAPRAVLVAPELDSAQTTSVREQLLSAGFAKVTVLVNVPQGADVEAAGAQAAA